MKLKAKALYTQEALAVHAALDTVNVPRDIEDEPLSMSQRVTGLVLAYQALQATKLALAKAASL